jgi:hypothetical protein
MKHYCKLGAFPYKEFRIGINLCLSALRIISIFIAPRLRLGKEYIFLLKTKINFSINGRILIFTNHCNLATKVTLWNVNLQIRRLLGYINLEN